MRRYHRVALAAALVGWYLMLPPELPSLGQDRFDPNAPLSQWTKYPQFTPTVYPTQSACELDVGVQGGMVTKINPRWGALFSYAQCVRTDDPRIRRRLQ